MAYWAALWRASLVQTTMLTKTNTQNQPTTRACKAQITDLSNQNLSLAAIDSGRNFPTEIYIL
jgi:hypothetical protein